MFLLDGIRDQEQKCINTILKQISTMRDNAYYLKRHIWNEVLDDWPFYTEQERQVLKRSVFIIFLKLQFYYIYFSFCV